MRRKTITLTPVAADADGIAVLATQVTATSGTLSATGVLVSNDIATLTIPAHIAIASATTATGHTFTVNGTDRNGYEISEDVVGNTATGPAYTTMNFKTVTSITFVAASATMSTGVNVGTAAALETQWVPMNQYAPAFSIGLTIDGTATVTIENTYDDVFDENFREGAANPQNTTATNLVAATGSAQGTITGPVSAIRGKIVSFTTGAVITLNIIPEAL